MVDQPPLYDVGRLAVLIAGRPIAAYINHGEADPDQLTTARQLRDDVRTQPDNAIDAHIVAGLRMMAWIVIGVVGFIGGILVSLVPSPGPLLDPVLTALVIVATCSFLFASMSMLIQIGRITLIQLLGERGFPQEGIRGKSRGRRRGRKRATLPAPPNRFARWLCTPSWFDAVPALLWTLLLAPSLIGMAA